MNYERQQITRKETTVKTVSLTTEPFTCPSCVKKIEKALTFKDGVQAVRVLFNSSRVQITYDDAKASPEELAETVTKLGYPVLRVA